MSQRVKEIRKKHFDHVVGDWQTYHNLISEYLTNDSVVLDVGCGKGHIAPYPWDKYPGVTLIGIDPDPQACENRYLSQFILLTNEVEWPVDDASCDIVLARYVLEHGSIPDTFL